MENVVFKDWVEEWLEFKRRYVKESTYANYLILLKNQILPAIGERKLGEINTKVVQELVGEWVEYGRIDGKGGLSKKTIRDLVTILKLCIHDYGKMHCCNTPVIEIEYPTNMKSERREVLSKEQQEYLLNVIKKNLEFESLGYAFSLYTGIRIGELCALKWADVDMKKHSIIVSKTLQRIYIKGEKGRTGNTKITITSPKSAKAVREIPLSEALYEMVNTLCCHEKDAYLLTGTSKYIEPRLYRKHYQKFLKENHMEYIRFHGLRHTFATRCVESGADYKVVSEILGHASVNLTMNLYVHPQWEDKKRCVELI